MLAASTSIEVSASICLKRTLRSPSASARSCATLSISGTKSEQISVPPGSISSAARKPVSPGPAASSSSVSPGCGPSASTIQVATGIVARRSWSARTPHPFAVAVQRARLCCRMSSLIAAPGAGASQKRCAEASRSPRRPSGTLKRASRPATHVAQLLRVGGRAQHDARRDRLPPLRVRAAEHAGVGDGGVREQRRLDLGGRDVLAAGDDRVGLAADDLQAAACRRSGRGRPCAGRRRRRRSGPRRGSPRRPRA